MWPTTISTQILLRYPVIKNNNFLCDTCFVHLDFSHPIDPLPDYRYCTNLSIFYSQTLNRFLLQKPLQQNNFVFIFQSGHFVLSTNLLFKFNVSLPLVTGELLQNTVDFNNVAY